MIPDAASCEAGRHHPSGVSASSPHTTSPPVSGNVWATFAAARRHGERADRKAMTMASVPPSAHAPTVGSGTAGPRRLISRTSPGGCVSIDGIPLPNRRFPYVTRQTDLRRRSAGNDDPDRRRTRAPSILGDGARPRGSGASRRRARLRPQPACARRTRSASISGCHINPAVTVGLWAMKKTEERATCRTTSVGQIVGGSSAPAIHLRRSRTATTASAPRRPASRRTATARTPRRLRPRRGDHRRDRVHRDLHLRDREHEPEVDAGRLHRSRRRPHARARAHHHASRSTTRR